MNQPFAICPRWCADLSTWVFDDPTVELEQEPFVCPAVIDELANAVPNARDGFRLVFSDAPFPGFQRTLALQREENGGAWYGLDGSDLEGWLCPALFKYFDEAPARLYMSAEPISRRES